MSILKSLSASLMQAKQNIRVSKEQVGSALDETIREYGLSATVISEMSGISQAEISRLRNQTKDMHSANLASLVRALPLNAKLFFLSKIYLSSEEELHSLHMSFDN
jgi:predicted XRE-type DNA-binding protein